MSTACFADSIPTEKLTRGPGGKGGVAGFQFTATVTTTSPDGFTVDLNVLNITGTGGRAAATADLSEQT